MTRVAVDPGICGMHATIDVTDVGNQKVSVKITSDCEMVTKMGESLVEVDKWDVFKPPADSEVYKCASECPLHAACPVPMAILKAIEIEAGLAAPKAVHIRYEPTE